MEPTRGPASPWEILLHLDSIEGLGRRRALLTTTGHGVSTSASSMGLIFLKYISQAFESRQRWRASVPTMETLPFQHCKDAYFLHADNCAKGQLLQLTC